MLPDMLHSTGVCSLPCAVFRLQNQKGARYRGKETNRHPMNCKTSEYNKHMHDLHYISQHQRERTKVRDLFPMPPIATETKQHSAGTQSRR